MKKFWTLIGCGLVLAAGAYRIVNKKLLMDHCEKYNEQLIKMHDTIGRNYGEGAGDVQSHSVNGLLHVDK